MEQYGGHIFISLKHLERFDMGDYLDAVGNRQPISLSG